VNDYFSFAVVVLSLLGYFYLARRFRIMDKPNLRSSHTTPTIRGAGVVFFVSLLVWAVGNAWQYPYMIGGAFAIAFVSFLDDLRPQPSWIRIIVQIGALLLMLNQIPSQFELEWFKILAIIVISIGATNAFNFMDGINGITGIYSLVTLATLYFVNQNFIVFTSENLLLIIAWSVIVFLFFNFRVKAYCFAGDVGSVTISFLLLFFLLQLVYATQYYGWFILFGIYGIETVVTIFYRLLAGENIFLAHRSHLYQLLSNELRFSHRNVSLIYGFSQLILNILVLYYFHYPSFAQALAIMLTVSILHILVRELILRKIGMPSPLLRLFQPHLKA
jgi:UDP-GlcNAc:undecaprenyl-phosphate/decaprenyl-phosphate GlcNAc-1-phosphate transferase